MSRRKENGRSQSWCQRSVQMVCTVALLCLSGCGQFFVPENNSGGGGGGTTGTNRVYVANSLTSTLSAFTVGTNTLSAVSGSPFTLGYAPFDVVVTPSNSFVYVAGPAAIYAYSIGSDGSIAAVSGGAAVAVATVSSLAISPDGQWLFGLDSIQQTLDEYKINSSTGALTAVDASPYAPASGQWIPKMVRVAPTGNLVFLALGTAGDIVYTLNTTTGAVVNSQTLAPISNTTSDNAIAVNSTGTYLYIARTGTGGGVAVYTIGSGGALNSISGSPFSAGSQPSSLVIDSTGKYIYAANRGDNTISGYAIGTGSALTALTGSPYSSGSAVISLSLDKSGSYLLAGAYGGSPDLTMYSFDSTTAGKLNSATTIASGTSPAGVIAVTSTH